jgi:hypothetical protein
MKFYTIKKLVDLLVLFNIRSQKRRYACLTFPSPRGLILKDFLFI